MIFVYYKYTGEGHSVKLFDSRYELLRIASLRVLVLIFLPSQLLINKSIAYAIKSFTKLSAPRLRKVGPVQTYPSSRELSLLFVTKYNLNTRNILGAIIGKSAPIKC